MDKRRVVHREYGVGTIIEHAFIGLAPVTLVLFDLTNEQTLVPDDELESYIPKREKGSKDTDVDIKAALGKELEKVAAVSLVEVEEIREMSDETLVEGFEHVIRNGGGPGYRRVIFMKREMLRRMDSCMGEKEEGKGGI